jgi:hypothetical protein
MVGYCKGVVVDNEGTYPIIIKGSIVFELDKKEQRPNAIAIFAKIENGDGAHGFYMLH